VVLGAADDGEAGVLGSDVGGDPDGFEILHVPAGARYLTMDGPELFRRATRALASSGAAALERAGAGPADVDLYVPHQANARIISSAAQRLGIAPERTVVSLGDVGNTSAASVPLALAAARDDGRLVDGTRALLTGVGAGLAWASLYLRWSR
jgi:3-oxoacyl-[acyl-carrier-protein] synthase-3